MSALAPLSYWSIILGITFGAASETAVVVVDELDVPAGGALLRLCLGTPSESRKLPGAESPSGRGKWLARYVACPIHLATASTRMNKLRILLRSASVIRCSWATDLANATIPNAQMPIPNAWIVDRLMI